MYMNEQIREAAEQARARLHLTQDDVAKGAGVKQATVSRLLAGERAGEPDTWLRILDVLRGCLKNTPTCAWVGVDDESKAVYDRLAG